MPLSCFRPVGRHSQQLDLDEPFRPRSTFHSTGTPKKSRMLPRHGSADSRASTASNDSISKLPPCKRASDEQLEKLMMPVPPEPRPSRCLRLSQPKTYSDIVDSMKASKGCRDWRNFAVFYNDDVDVNVSAVETARKRAIQYERKLRQLNSFTNDSDQSSEIDMIA